MTDSQKLLAGALLAGGSLLTGNATLITVAGGIGVNWSSEALAGLWDSRTLAIQSGDALAKAYQRAIRRAVDDLRRQYPHTGNACTLLQAFDLVAACAGRIGEAQFPPTLEVAAIQDTLATNLDRLLYGHDEREIAFLQKNLLPAVARSFRTELAVDEEAWRRYHGWLIEQMAATSARAAGVAATTTTASASTPPEMDKVLAAFEDIAGTQAKLDASATRLEELIRLWEETAAQGVVGATITFHNEGMQATNVVQGQDAHSQSAVAKDGGTATVFNITGAALTPDLLKALLGGQAAPSPAQPTSQTPGPLLPLANLPPKLDGRRFSALQEALLDAFTRESLREMVKFSLNQTLDHIAGGSTLNAVVYDLIEWAQRTGRLPDLLQGAHKAVPYNPKLNAFLRDLSATP